MKILILANHLNPGGISSYIITLAQGLALRGHKVYIGSSGGDWERRANGDNVEHIFIPLKTKSVISPKLFLAQRILQRFIIEKQIDIIHAQTRITGWLAYWLARRNPVGYCYTTHGFLKPRWGRRLYPCWSPLVIAISEPVRQHLIDDFKLQPQRIRLVHNGVKASGLRSLVPGRESEIKKIFGLKEHPVVGIIARLSDVKGHTYLLMAMRDVIKEIPGAQLLSIGDGRIREDLNLQAAYLGIENNVHFIPSVLDTTEAFSVMDVFVMPSLEEGLGLAIMEAMSFGVPVIASSVGGITSLVKDGSSGLLVGPADSKALAAAIIDLLKNKEKGLALAANARVLIAKEFSIDKMVKETEKVYKECLS